MTNPFDYQRPLAPGLLIDREHELDLLKRAATNRVLTRISAPRRYGKTTLLLAHLQRLAAVGHHTWYVDFDRVATIPDVAARLASGLRRGARTREILASLLARLDLSLTMMGPRATLMHRNGGQEISPDGARAAIRDLLEIPARLAADGDLVVCAFDEFQDLLTADDRLDGLMRSVIQHQGQAVAYLFAGSRPSLMRSLFTDAERPFFGQARAIDLPPLPAAETIVDILALMPTEAGSTANDELATDVAAIVRFGAGHPQRTILLAHHLYELIAERTSLADRPQRALELALAEIDDVLHAIWDGLDRHERAIVTALASGHPPTSAAVAAAHGTSRSTLGDALKRLLRDGQQIVRANADRRPSLLDPLLGEWIRRR